MVQRSVAHARENARLLSGARVNSQHAYRRGEHFWLELAGANAAVRVATSVPVSATGKATNDQRLVYDGWQAMEMFEGSRNRQTAYLRGLNLSATSQGAGGRGGLRTRTLSPSATACGAGGKSG